jgi:hypothetical protein
MEAVMTTGNGQIDATAAPRRRRRTGKKRVRFSVPTAMPPGVRELWRSASNEEQDKAHQTSVQILQLWLGKKNREEVAEHLSIPPLRVWQLSQQALSGMLAGLLKQPRSRRGRPTLQPTSEDDPRLLKKRIVELEQTVRDRENLIRLVGQMPKPRSGAPESTSATKPRHHKRVSGRDEGEDHGNAEGRSAAR